MIEAPRKLLGSWRGLAIRELVYEKPDGLEIDSSQYYEITRRRVLYDEVLMITFHHTSSPGVLAVTGLTSIFLIGLGMFVVSVSAKAWLAGMIIVLLGVPTLIGFIVGLRGVDVVTVFGRRSKAAIKFRDRTKGREVYGRLCATVRNLHRRLEQKYAAEAAAAAPSVEMPPEPPAAE
jgi:hypothetical protein